MNRCVPAALLVWLASTMVGAQPPRIEVLLAAVAPALPFPRASADGQLPIDGLATAKWFVDATPADEPPVVTVKANPLHPDTQKASTAAMVRIQTAVEAAERRAQASYERAIEELRRTGKPVDVDQISLDDEGVEGERIDAELQLAIAWQDVERSFTIASSVAPTVTPGTRGASWIVMVRANTYREGQPPNERERYRAAEAHVYLGVSAAPTVGMRSGASSFTVSVTPAADAAAVILRGNETLLTQVLEAADWTGLVNR